MSGRTLLLALMLLSGAGCHHAAGAGESSGLPDADETIAIRVVNHSQLDATVYLVHDGTRDRLGTVTAASSATFPVQTRTLGSGEFVLLADPVGSRRTATTERLHVSQGNVFTWTLESDFSRGSVLVQE